MAKNLPQYVVESKVLMTTLNRCSGIIALGNKAETNSVTFVFTKKGLTVEVGNSVATYRSDLPVKVAAPVGSTLRVCLMAELLLAYSKNYASLTLMPGEDVLTVKAGKAFSAQIYYVGAPEDITVETPESGDDIARVARVVGVVLPQLGGMRNRTSREPLGVRLEWDKASVRLVVGDTHHAAIIDTPCKSRSARKLVMTMPNLQKIIEIGANFAVEEDRFVAWSDTDYLALSSQSEDLFTASEAEEAFANKKVGIAQIKSDAFRKMISTLTDAIEQTAPISFDVSEGELRASVSTNAGKALAKMAVQSYKGKPKRISVSVHHLLDCLSVIKSSELQFTVYESMLGLHAKDDKIVYRAAMSGTAELNG